MVDENEFIARGEENAPEPSKTEKKKKKTSTGRKKTTKKKKTTSPFSTIIERFSTKKVKSSIGVGLILLASFLLLANMSYLFTWQEDQNRVISKGLFEFLFDGTEDPAANWLGRFGAWTSHLLIYRWFGLASFTFPLVLFILGFKALFNVPLLPISKTLSACALFTVWFSAMFGFFSSQISYLGGSFGFQLNEWFKLTLGTFGTLFLLIGTGYVFALITLNINFGKILSFIGLNKKEADEQEVLSESDLEVSNVLDPNQTTEDLIAKTVHFKEEEELENQVSEEEASEIIDETEGPVEEETVIEDMEPIAAPEEELGDEEFSVEVAKEDEEDKSLSEDEVDKKRQEYGEYDPTLDLANYALPSIELLKDYKNSGGSVSKEELEENKNKIVTTLSNYKIEISKIRATVGPTVTLYEIVPAPGVRISKIKNLEDDIALSLAALGIRIIAPIPGKGTIGIEVPNSNPDMVSMRSLIASKKFQESDYELPVVMGKTITNETFTFDLAKMPHLLVAGATGQGKSVGLNAILISLLYKKHPSQVKFVLVDPKKVELTLYNRIERHFLAKLPDEEDAIITDTSKVVNTLNSLCIEMDQRYELLKAAHVRNIKEYNQKFIGRKLNPENGHRYLPYIVVLIDEFADLIMTAGKEIEQPIARIAQLARAIGIHLIVATQRPSVNVITGMIKANFPARIAFRVLSKIDSRTILDSSGADQLIGRGDMLISTGQDVIRLQCGFVDTPEVDDICAFIGDQRAYPEALLLPEYVGESSESGGNMDDEDLDKLFADAARIVVMHQQGSASLLQRKLKLGYNRAGRIIDQLEGHGIIGPFKGSKARDVLYADEIGLDEYLASKGIL
ncbi:MAG: DNA translocase FtsK 4TM domain-containing protein [Crocinitomicaceae bacterium]|nr:DNA translocase FtsK 4TM domain-containing protein [Crocinitomicaceae bacterium]